MNDVAHSDARELLSRWDAQQTAYIKHRDQRFAVMVDTIERLAGPAPRVLDLACGPGSLSAAILDSLPRATVVAVDKDPVLLAIARDALGHHAGLSVVSADLDELAWLDGISGSFDAVVSSTALHWLAPDVLARLYFALCGRVRQGGLFLNADHLLYDDVALPDLWRLARLDDEVNQKLAFGSGTDSWDEWWALAEAHPAYREAAAARKAVWDGKLPPPKVTLGFHLESLRSAGFRQAGTIWQYLDDYVVCAVR